MTRTTPTMNFESSPDFENLMKTPNTIATKIYIIEIDAADAPGTFWLPSFVNPLNVPARMSANAAMTSNVKSQQKSRNNFRPVLPI